MSFFVVDCSVLSGCDSLDAGVGYESHIVAIALQSGIGNVWSMTNLKLYATGRKVAPNVFAEVMESGQVDDVSVLSGGVVALRDVKDVVRYILLYDEPGTTAQEKTFALTDGVEPIAFVGAEFASCFKFDNVALALAKVTAEEVVVVDFPEEADTLRVLALSTGKMGGACDVAHLRLHQTSYREHEFRNLATVELREEIGLVFQRVFGCGEELDAVDDVGSSVVSCGDAVVRIAATLLESAELDELVAHNVRVRRKPIADGFDGVGDDAIPIFAMKVDDLETAAVLLCEPGDNLDVLLGRAVGIAVFFFLTYADVEDVGVVALLLEQVNDHGAVNSAGNKCGDLHKSNFELGAYEEVT